jgi:hypothetical protein
MIGQDYRRTHRVAPARFSFGFDELGGTRWDRSPTQRFEQIASEAVNKYLVPIGLLPSAAGSVVLESVIRRLSGTPGTFNSPAFVLVFCCYDFSRNRFRDQDLSSATATTSRKITDALIRADGLTWPDLVRLIKNPKLATHLRREGKNTVVQLWETFLKSNGITVPDLIRYLMYSKEHLEGKIVISEED